jgi:hypothetical protein
MLKYFFEFTDVEQNNHRVEIYNDAYFGESTRVFGSCQLTYSSTDDILESIRGCGLKIDLEANSDLTFNDLYSEEERTFSVIYKRNNLTLFSGWLNPEGIYENLVQDVYIISLNCVDGIGFLKNLSYVENNGLPFSGKQSLLEIVVNCLNRTLTPQDILINCDIYYNGLNENLSTFENVYFNSDRFIKDDKDTIMNCDEVLRSVLEPFGCVITNYEGKWIIYKPNTLTSNSELTFFTYDSDGVSKSNTTIDFSINVGSQIDNFYPFHAEGNQQKSIKSSIGAYRINYKYGLNKKISNNPTFENNGTTIDNWTINDATGVILTTPNILELVPITGTPILKITSDNNTIQEGQSLAISISTTMTDEITLDDTTVEDPRYDAEIGYKIKIVGTTETYYLRQYNTTSGYVTEWSDTIDTLRKVIYGGGYDLNEIKTFELDLPPTPIDGSLSIEIHSIKLINETTVTNYGKIRFNNITLNVGQDSSSIEGENHTFQRIAKPSTKIKEKKEVFNGDLKSDIYEGAIYKNDETTLTDKWNRKGVDESKFLLRIMGEERMKMYPEPLIIFQGSFFGFFNYLSAITINKINGKYIPIEYNYNCKRNTIEVKLMQMRNANIVDDIDYLITYDYGKVVEPTITN